MILCDMSDMPAARSVLGDLSVGDVVVDEQTTRLTAPVTGGGDVLKEVLERFARQNVEVYDVGVRRPTLDDVFLSLTGHAAEEVKEDGENSSKPKRGRRADREKEAVR